MRNLPCWNALDGLSHTLWQPKQSGRSKPIFTVTFSKEVVLSRIELEQYRWSAGYAKLLRCVAVEYTHFKLRRKESY